MDACRSCHATIQWRKTVAGKNVPLDPEPHPEGNIYIDEAGVAVYATAGSRQVMYRSHFVTCPDAARHRRRR
jgi:hypothetical protein